MVAKQKREHQFYMMFPFGWKTGLEPATFGTTIRRSNLLSYIHRFADANLEIKSLHNNTHDKVFSSKLFQAKYYFEVLREIVP